MNRQQAVSLLKEIVTTCSSFLDATIVSINNTEVKDSWELQINWVPNLLEIECLKKIISKYGAEISVLNEKTIFH